MLNFKRTKECIQCEWHCSIRQYTAGRSIGWNWASVSYYTFCHKWGAMMHCCIVLIHFMALSISISYLLCYYFIWKLVIRCDSYYTFLSSICLDVCNELCFGCVFVIRKARWDFGLSGDSTEAKGRRLQSSHGEATSYQSPNDTSRNQCKIQYVHTHSNYHKVSHFSCIDQICYLYTVELYTVEFLIEKLILCRLMLV